MNYIREYKSEIIKADLNRFESEHIGRPLLSNRAILQSEAILMRHHLPLHPDKAKNWDVLLALAAAYRCVLVDEPVLDAGAEHYSTFLDGMRILGYNRLIGMNITFDGVYQLSGIGYRAGDVTDSKLPGHFFGMVACLSVIEHGVSIGAFMKEQARILKPGGLLFISFDFWHHHVNTSNHEAYGAPVKILDLTDVDNIINSANLAGFELTHPINLCCDERVVTWPIFNISYTFMSLLFRMKSR